MRKRVPARLPALLLALLLAVSPGWATGCSFAPGYVRPDMDLPADTGRRASVPVQWWRNYDDPILNALVREALQYNKDIAASLARIEQAAAMAGVSRSDLFPAPALDADSSQNWLSTKSMGGALPGYERVRNHDVALGAAWELDLWGRYRNSLYSAVAGVHETQSAHDATMLLVAANTVKAYASLLSARNQAKISEATVRQRQDAVRYFRTTEEAGSGSSGELGRALGELEQARYNLHTARMEEDLAFSALCLLLGRSPRQITEEKGLSLPENSRLRVLDNVPDNLPMNLIEQRPDIRAAEYALMAAHFDIGVIRAQYLPSLTISGSFGWSAKNASQIGLTGASTWMYGGSVHLPLDFWSTRFQELMAEARCRELVSTYEKTVLTAFGDVRSAVARQQHLARAGQALENMIKELRKSSNIIRTRFHEGYSTYLEMLDAERSLFEAQLTREELLHSRVVAEVDLYMALGGGWTEDAYSAAVLRQEGRAPSAQSPLSGNGQEKIVP